jgi:hypothetical protein
MKTPSTFAPETERTAEQPVAVASSLSHDAAGAAAGFLFQPERALFWLAEAADPDARVGIEAFGDVFVSFPDAPGIHEEDKHSVQAEGQPLGDHDPRLWRTLEIWSDAKLNGTKEEAEARLLLVTNRPIAQDPIRTLRAGKKRNRSTWGARLLVLQLAAASKKDECHRCIARMRQMADAIPPSLNALYNRVMAYEDGILTSVIERFELWHGASTSGAELRRQIIGRLHLPADINAEHVIHAISGWLHEIVLEKWRRREPAWVSRRCFDTELDRIRLRLKRDKLLARSATRLPLLAAGQKDSARQERFVEHLAQIAVDETELDDAIEDYLRFGIEYLRLLNSGEVLITDWDDRAGQLQDRWKRIARQVRRRNGDIDSAQLGQDILDDTLSPDYLAPLAGEPQPEPYFTRGHYHRIADEDRVWWYPCDEPDY